MYSEYMYVFMGIFRGIQLKPPNESVSIIKA